VFVVVEVEVEVEVEGMMGTGDWSTRWNLAVIEEAQSRPIQYTV
jgi:hypothetical protein